MKKVVDTRNIVLYNVVTAKENRAMGGPKMKKLTAYNKANDRQIEMMMGKAMCAYANMAEVEKNKSELVAIHGRHQVLMTIECHKSEYEATVRCIEMFVKESLPEICRAVIDSCKEEFGI